jgi:hypothetical protein
MWLAVSCVLESDDVTVMTHHTDPTSFCVGIPIVTTVGWLLIPLAVYNALVTYWVYTMVFLAFYWVYVSQSVSPLFPLGIGHH